MADVNEVNVNVHPVMDKNSAQTKSQPTINDKGEVQHKQEPPKDSKEAAEQKESSGTPNAQAESEGKE